jgi:hypothetical protein
MTEKESMKITGENRVSPVSWSLAYRDGLMLTIHHKVFTLIAAFSVVCERSVSLFTAFTGIGLDQVFADYRELLVTFPSPIRHDFTAPLPFRGFLSFLPVAVGLFLLGAFLLIGILGLIRDLLIRKGYRVQEVFTRGREYFWPIFKFKVPVYFINAVYLAVAAPPLLSFSGSKVAYMLWLSIALFFFFVLFIVGRVALSLGPKIIVVEEKRRVMDIYRRVIETVKPAMWQAAIFYTLMIGIMAIGILVPWGIARIGLPSILEIILSVFFMAFVTVMMKASSFSMYIQLVSLSTEPAGKQADAEAEGGLEDFHIKLTDEG